MPEGLLNLSQRHAILFRSCPWQVYGLIKQLPRGAPEIAGEHKYLFLVAGQCPIQGLETRCAAQRHQSRLPVQGFLESGVKMHASILPQRPVNRERATSALSALHQALPIGSV